ncbi:MAG: DUF885 domain-containing protein, partial [Sciscionella sp.]
MSSTESTSSATARGVHQICDAYVQRYAELDPLTATFIGVPGHDEDLTDFSPEGQAGRTELARRALREVGAADPQTASEALAQAVFTERTSRE